MMFDVALFSTCLLLVVSPYFIARVVRPRNQSREAGGQSAGATTPRPSGSGTGPSSSATILEFSSATGWPSVSPTWPQAAAGPLPLATRKVPGSPAPSVPSPARSETSLDEAAVESLIARAASAAAQAASLSTVARAAASRARAASRRASEAARLVDHAADTLAATRGFSLARTTLTQTPLTQPASLTEPYPTRDFPQPVHRTA